MWRRWNAAETCPVEIGGKVQISVAFSENAASLSYKVQAHLARVGKRLCLVFKSLVLVTTAMAGDAPNSCLKHPVLMPQTLLGAGCGPVSKKSTCLQIEQWSQPSPLPPDLKVKPWKNGTWKGNDTYCRNESMDRVTGQWFAAVAGLQSVFSLTSCPFCS